MNRSIFAAGIFALVGCLSLGAQSIKLTATIPFEFRIGAHQMPAGDYLVSHTSGVLTLRRESGKYNAANVLVFGTRKGSNGTSSKLVFNRYGEDYFLANVWQAGEPTGLEVPKGKIEKEMASRGPGPIQTASVRLQAK